MSTWALPYALLVGPGAPIRGESPRRAWARREKLSMLTHEYGGCLCQLGLF